MAVHELPKFVLENYQVREWRHATAILKNDFPSEYGDLMEVLTDFRLKKSWVSVGGGNKSELAKWLDDQLGKKGWEAKNFDTKISVDGNLLESPTHEVDCFKNKIALELEWNNKDPFYDRDLNKLRRFYSICAPFPASSPLQV